MRLHRKITALGILLLVSAAFFLLWGLNENNWDYNLPRRTIRLLAILLAGAGIGSSTIVFQSVTNNRLLTPGVMGLDSLYMFIQTLVIYMFGSKQIVTMTAMTDFVLSVGIMVLFSLGLFRFLFLKEDRKLFTVILAGMIIGGLFGSMSTFMQVLIDPNEFLIVQDRMFASFNNVNTSLLGISAVITGIIFAGGFLKTGQLDVLSLGRDISVNLGIPYEKAVNKYMIFTAILISVTTALTGPVTFLGLLTANLSRQLLKTYKHSYLLTGAALISACALVFGQFIVERVLVFNTTISVIINFVGGIYFIYLLIKEGKM